MFAERFDSLMNIAEMSNSRLGRAVNMDSSYISRLRSGARPLSKRHEYLTLMCRHLAKNLQKDYQLNALQELTGIGAENLVSREGTALYLEHWLLGTETDVRSASGRLVSGFAHSSTATAFPPEVSNVSGVGPVAPYLYGNGGKRRAVEQFFQLILQEEKPQTLLLFSEEDMTWMYEDPAFARRWKELFTAVLAAGNRVRIIHTISRNFNDLMEAVTKWIPIYMTGRIEPYYYPRLRDGVFHHTMFIAPETAAIFATSIQQETDGMLHFFLTNKAALAALTAEFNAYLDLCRPLMRIITEHELETMRNLWTVSERAEGNGCLACDVPPLFAMPEELVRTLTKDGADGSLVECWKESVIAFCKNIKRYRLHVIVPHPDMLEKNNMSLRLPLAAVFGAGEIRLSPEQYRAHWDRLLYLEKRHENLTVHARGEDKLGSLLYIKEDAFALMARPEAPTAAFYVSEPNMVNAFWAYMNRQITESHPGRL